MNERVLQHPPTVRVAFACIAVLLFAGVVAAATYSTAGGVGEARLTAKGRAAVISEAGARREVSGVVALHRGETVQAIDGPMTIELPNGVTVEGRPALNVSDPTRVKIAQPVELLAGDLLVMARRGTDIVAGGNRIHLDQVGDDATAARISRSLGVATSVYRGTAKFDSAGQVRDVPALRTLEVSSLGRPPAGPSPLKIDDNQPDPWDRRFLGEAIDLGHTLDRYSETYTATLGTGNGRTPGFYRQILPSLADQAELTADLLTASPHTPGDLIVGGAIAGLGRRGGFTQRWNELFAFKDAGASWGFVALDQGVASGPLLSEVQNALNATPFEFAAGGPPPTTGGNATPTTAVVTTTTQSTARGDSGPTTTSPPPTTPPPTTAVPAPPTGSPLVDGVVNEVNQIVGGLLGGRPPGG